MLVISTEAVPWASAARAGLELEADLRDTDWNAKIIRGGCP